jgi:hypothetical protein
LNRSAPAKPTASPAVQDENAPRNTVGKERAATPPVKQRLVSPPPAPRAVNPHQASEPFADVTNEVEERAHRSSTKLTKAPVCANNKRVSAENEKGKSRRAEIEARKTFQTQQRTSTTFKF